MAFQDVGVRAVVDGFNDFQSKLGRMSSSVVGFGKTAAKVALGGVAAFGAAAAGVAAISLQSAISFEDAWTGVVKTTDGLVDSTGQLTESGQALQQGFRDLAKEVPISVEELMKIGELGGQLGIAKEDLVDFTNTVAAIGVTTNLTTEEAATEFARMANIMGTPQEEISNMASAVVALGNNFATTERDVLNFASRIAGAGAIAGLTEADVFAIGAAMSSVGIEAEAGGTAVQKVLLGMNEAVALGGDQLEIFAAVAGETTEDFADMWKKDAGKSFDAFVKGLGNAGDDAIVILDELGLKDQRLIRSFLSLAGAGDLLTESLEMSTEAFDDNVALQEEADLRYKTTSSQMQLLKNNLKDVGITIGQALLPFLNQLLQAAMPLITELGQRLPGFIENNLKPALQTAATWLGENIPKAIQAIGWYWENVGKPGFEAIGRFIKDPLIPFIQRLATWLGENIPKAMTEAKSFWENTLRPALEALWAFIQDPVIPIIEKVYNWLKTNIPEAFQAVKSFWEETLLPAFRDMWNYIQENVLPRLEDIYNWLYTNIPLAFQEAKAFWDSTLHPMLTDLWEFVRDNVIPIISDVFTWLSEKIPEAFEIVKGFWEETLRPALEGIYDFFNENIVPILKDVFYFLADVKEGVVGAFISLRKWWDKNYETLAPIIAFFDNLLGKLKSIWDWIGKVKDKLGELGGGTGYADEGWGYGGDFVGQQTGGWWKRSGMARLHPNEMVLPLTNQAGINALSRAMRQAMMPLMAPMALAGGGSQNIVNLNMNNNINSAMDVAVLEARIERVVNNAMSR